MKHTDTLCGQNAELFFVLILKQLVHNEELQNAFCSIILLGSINEEYERGGACSTHGSDFNKKI
jgi:hypothetical protein